LVVGDPGEVGGLLKDTASRVSLNGRAKAKVSVSVTANSEDGWLRSGGIGDPQAAARS
jgi:hypothetical protein